MSGRLERLKLEYQRELHKQNNLVRIGIVTVLTPLVNGFIFNREQLVISIIVAGVIFYYIHVKYAYANKRLTATARKLDKEQ